MTEKTRRDMLKGVVGVAALAGCVAWAKSGEENPESNTREGGESTETQENETTEKSDSSATTYNFENQVRKSISCEVRDYSKKGAEGAEFGQLNVLTCNPNEDIKVGEQMLKIAKTYADYVENSEEAPMLLYCDMFLTGAQQAMGGFHISVDWAKSYNAGELSESEYLGEIETSIWTN